MIRDEILLSGPCPSRQPITVVSMVLRCVADVDGPLANTAPVQRKEFSEGALRRQQLLRDIRKVSPTIPVYGTGRGGRAAVHGG
jgi:hypothetical protein